MTTVELPYPLRTYQLDAWERLQRFSCLVWHRRAGKTVFAVYRLVVAALNTRLKAARYGYLAPYYRQAKEIAWGYLRQMLSVIPGAKFNESELQAELPNGARVRLYGADNPDALRGLYFDGIVLDEVADMRPQVWGEIVRPALADREGWALFIGTPKGVNLFSELYYKALKEPGWYGDLRRATETGAISAEELARARAEMSASQWAQEMDCDFAAAVANVVCPLAAVVAAQQRNCTEQDIEGYPLVIGVDVARFGKDRSVAFQRQGRVAFTPRVWRGVDTMTLASHVAMLLEEKRAAAVFVDDCGVGGGVTDRLRQLGFRTVAVNGAEAALRTDVKLKNRRAEMWWAMAEWLRDGCLPESQDLVTDLTGTTYFYDAAGRIQLEGKQDMEDRGLRSPDLADALALTFAEPVAIAQHPLAAHASAHPTNHVTDA